MSSNDDQRRRIRRLQNWLIVMAVVVVFLGIAAPTVVIVYTNAAEEETQTTIICENVETLNAMLEVAQANRELTESIARSLGLPIPEQPPIVFPKLPEECRE